MTNHRTRRQGPRRALRTGRPLQLESLERRYLMVGDLAHNELRPADVNDDRLVNIADALMCVSRFRSEFLRRDAEYPHGYYDVNGDQQFNLADPLHVLAELRRQRRAQRPSEDKEFQSIDGVGNNRANIDWGAAETSLLRAAPADYADGLETPAGDDRPSPRAISNAVAAQQTTSVNARGLTDMVWQWGQFLDHDIDLTPGADPAEAFDIAVPAGDVFFDPAAAGDRTIGLNRSAYDKESGAEYGVPRQQMNVITAFIDGSNVYGSDSERAAALRTFEGGRLKVSDGDLLPFNEAGLPNAGGPGSELFLAGDERANEQAGLAAMHTLWVREHNRIAAELVAADPEIGDEMAYQQARRLVIAQMQVITYQEFLPALLGEGALRRYRGYDPAVNPGIANLFSTAAYRFGHSMLSSEVLRLDANGEVAESGNLPLRAAFFNPAAITEHGIDTLLRGLASQVAQEIDSELVDDVRNFLFGPPGSGGFDLASLNIQRGRDHGLPSYNDARAQLGLSRAESFADITSDVQRQEALAEVYGDDVNQIDAWVGMLAEDHVNGGSLGELARRVIVDQFERLRDGDRFWYQRTLSGDTLRRVERTTLADVIERNTEIRGLQRNVFFAAEQSERPQRGGRGSGEPLQSAPGEQPALASAQESRRDRAEDAVFAQLADPPAPPIGIPESADPDTGAGQPLTATAADELFRDELLSSDRNGLSI